MNERESRRCRDALVSSILGLRPPADEFGLFKVASGPPGPTGLVGATPSAGPGGPGSTSIRPKSKNRVTLIQPLRGRIVYPVMIRVLSRVSRATATLLRRRLGVPNAGWNKGQLYHCDFPPGFLPDPNAAPAPRHAPRIDGPHCNNEVRIFERGNAMRIATTTKGNAAKGAILRHRAKTRSNQDKGRAKRPTVSAQSNRRAAMRHRSVALWAAKRLSSRCEYMSGLRRVPAAWPRRAAVAARCSFGRPRRSRPERPCRVASTRPARPAARSPTGDKPM